MPNPLPFLFLRCLRRRLGGGCCLFCLLWSLTGCSSMNFDRLFISLNPDALPPHQQSRLSCSIQTGLQSETDFALASSGTFSFGLRMPSSFDQDMEYDRRFDEYHDCLRSVGL